MACFNQKSLDLMVSTLLTACRKTFKNSQIMTVLERNAKKFKSSSVDGILNGTIAADIGVNWFNQMKTNAELKRCMTLLCYYQIPYPKATSFNILCSGLLLMSHKVVAELKKKELAKVLEYGLADRVFTMVLANNLQQMLPMDDLKSNMMCIRPKFYKDPIIEQHQVGSLEYQYQQMTDEYMPWLKKSFLAMGFIPKLNPNEPPIPPRPDDEWEGEMWDMLYENHESPNDKAIEKAQTMFDFSVEGGMNEDEALLMLDAVLQAEDILCISENWFNFSATGKCVDKSVISTDELTQKKIKYMISQMFDLQTLDDEHKEAQGWQKDFFESVFGKTIIEDIHKEYTKGDPVQLRLFSDPNSSDTSNKKASESVMGRSNVRECHLLPLSRGSQIKDSTVLEYKYDYLDDLPQVSKSRNQRKQDNFFSQLNSGQSYLQRMVLRMRVTPMSHEITKDSTFGRQVYVNNRFDVALTLIHELMHTYFAMVDFYYRDMSTSTIFTGDSKKGPVSYSGLSLGKKNTTQMQDKDGLQQRVATQAYPIGREFDVSVYNWQINNVDNYMVLFTKLYLIDEELVEQKYTNGDANAYADKETLAKFRLSFLRSFTDAANAPQEVSQYDIVKLREIKEEQQNMDYLTKLERWCWERSNKRYASILQETEKTTKFSQRFE